MRVDADFFCQPHASQQESSWRENSEVNDLFNYFITIVERNNFFMLHDIR